MNSEGMKLRSLHIEDYKMFKDFDIDFVDSDGEPLPIVVLAGVNGSGKTTLLECLSGDDKEVVIKKDISGSKLNIKTNTNPLITATEYNIKKQQWELHKSRFIYLPVGTDRIENIKQTIRQKYIDRAFEIDKPSEALQELQDFISTVFKGLKLTFNLSSIHYTKNIVLFKDNNGNEFDIDKLSTGEKTLLSKVLYLFFQDYKNKVILIDEPELSLHPSWQNRVLKIYENFAIANNCQVIIATHSPHIVGSAKSESLRILKKVDDKVEVFKYSQSYGFEFSKVLTDIMDVEYLRTPEVGKRLAKVKSMIVSNEFDSKNFKDEWKELESLLGEKNLDLKLLKLEIASRKKNV